MFLTALSLYCLQSNFSDDSNPRPVIASGQVEALMEEHNEERCKHPCAPANLVRHLDSSMKTGLGLKEIHESFGIPFLNVLVSSDMGVVYFFLRGYISLFQGC